MNSDDHLALIRAGVVAGEGTWADLGSGGGAFSLALVRLLGDRAQVYCVDRDAVALRRLRREVGALHPLVKIVFGDFKGEVELPPLDGILMANSLHFHPDACEILAHVAQWLKPSGRLIIVEYDIDTPNPWVPHPLPWHRLPAVLQCAGFSGARLLGTRPSRFHQRVYAAASEAADSRPDGQRLV
jgi:SAM-dependent methyltransferase